MQLTGEEVDTQVAVLTSSWGRGDTDDLARTALKDHDVAEADMVAWDRDSIRAWLGLT